MQIITISGLDGSGKSTQISLLKNALEAHGYKVHYFHAITFSIAHLLNHGKKCAPDGKTPDVTQAPWLHIQLRKFALFIDLIRFRIFCTELHMKGYDYLLTDRYFFDSIVNISFLSHKKYIPFFHHLIIAPQHAFFLSVDPYKIMQREHAPVQGIQYLIDKDHLYHDMTANFHFTVIDGDRERDVIAQEIITYVLANNTPSL